jgi:rRNA processing protein Gar1
MSRRHHQGNNNNKRRSGWDDDDEVVDDLAHAATFAMMTMPTTTSTTETSPLEILPGGAAVNTNTNTNEKVVLPIDDSAMIEDAENDGDIELEESSTEGESESGDDDSNKKEEDDDDDDDDDDQSDEDLAEALARMDPDETLEEEDDDEQPSNKMSRPPKTENELDSYRTPIQELEKHLQFQLSVTPEEAGTTTAAGANTSRSLTASNLQLAGRIKHFMAFDRTIVVESSASNPHGDATSFLHEKAPLDEGTLLVLRVPPEQDESKAGNSLDDEQLIPLGRIFEVFGPVSQPLYTIRLPSKIPVASKKEQSKPAKSASAAQEKGTSMVDSTSVPPEAPSDKLDDKKSDGNNDSEQVAAAEGEPIGDAATQVVAQEEKQVTTSDTIASTPVERAPPDPWAPTGKYAKLLQKNNAVYYVRDEAKLIDTGFIMKMSRKGCGTYQQSQEIFRRYNLGVSNLLFAAYRCFQHL